MTSYPGPDDHGVPRREEPTWDQLFSPEDFAPANPPGIAPVVPRLATTRPKRPLIVTVAIIAVLAVVTGVVIWLVRPSDEPTTTTESTSLPTTSTEPPATASPNQQRLRALLPRGYSAPACTQGRTSAHALATLTCGRNDDVGGPLTAAYSLTEDTASLNAAFEEILRTSTVMECPGRIQSPGPWRRRATPQQISGMLFCGLHANRPTVVWTDEADRLLGVVHSGRQGPTLDAMYAWWSSHS